MGPFQDVLGPSQIQRDAAAALDGVPIAASLTPNSAAQVAACLSAARRSGIAIQLTGAGTKIGRGNRPAVGSIVQLSTCELRDPMSIQAAEGVASFGAGLKVAEVDAACRAQGMTTRLAWANPAASVGGTIAVEPPTPEQAPTRRLRDDLLGLEVALVDGSLTHCGGSVVKNVTGFDLVRLYCGSHGTLGAITSANLRLRPLPETEVALSREYPTVEDACAALASLRRAPAAALLHPLASGGAILSWKLEGVPDEVQSARDELSGDSLDGAVWAETRAAGVAEYSNPGGRAVAWLCAQPSQTGQLIAAAGQHWIAALPLSGAVRALIPGGELSALYDLCRRENWLITLEAAASEIKAKFDVFGNEPESLPLMRALKQRFDADGTLAPGRFLGGL